MYILSFDTQKYKCEQKPIFDKDTITGSGLTTVKKYDATNETATKTDELQNFIFSGISDLTQYNLIDENGDKVEFGIQVKETDLQAQAIDDLIMMNFEMQIEIEELKAKLGTE